MYTNSNNSRAVFSSRPLHRRYAFSLIEMTAVLALMAILAGIVTVNVRHHLIEGKRNAARTEISTIADALEGFYSTFGRYPTNDEGLAVLSQKTDKIPEPLLKQMPVDPWNHPYQYNQPGRNGEPYEIICFGADGREGGTGADQDIYSWDLKGAPRASPMHHHIEPNNGRAAFTTIEMVAVLLLSALMATLTIASLAGIRHSAQMDEVIDELAWSNDIVRKDAMRSHKELRLMIDPGTGTISEQQPTISDAVSQRNIYRLPQNFHLTRCILRGGDDAFGPIEIRVCATGLCASYALQITGPKQTCWALVAGLTGQVTRIDDEQKVSDILQDLSPAGNDAH